MKGIPRNGINKGWFKKGSSVNLGRKRPDMVNNDFRKGLPSWNKGLIGFIDKIHRQKMIDALPKGDTHWKWKGDEVGYQGVHKWITVTLGKQNRCSFCGTTEIRKYHWANISKEYKREITDWVRLCVPCHRKYDGSDEKMIKTRRENNK